MSPSPDRIKSLSAFLDKLRSKHAPKVLAQTNTSAAAPGPGAVGAEVTGANGAAAPISGEPTVATTAAETCSCHNDPILREFVRSFLMWESTMSRAEAALKRIDQSVVDVNELRVCMPDEVAQIIGANYPKAEERATRLRAGLNDIFRREHCVRLFHLAERSKKDARQYLESLTAIPQFVSARVALLSLGAHAFPLDERMLACMRQAKALQMEHDLAAATSLLERAVRAGEALEAYSALQAWADEVQTVVVRVGKAPRKPAGKPVAKPAVKNTAKPKRSTSSKPATASRDGKKKKADK